MEQTDERILEFLDDVGWATPHIMARERGFDATEGRIGDRCERLVYAGFITPLHRKTYEITQWGRLYLQGEIDAEHQPTPTKERALR